MNQYDKWESKEYHEHPLRKDGTCGKVCLTNAGIFCLRVGYQIVTVPQGWAAKIYKQEQ